MSALEPSLKFEDLLATVQESERGRWFIAEFEARLRRAETASIFAAIGKLENVIAGQGMGNMDTALVARARTAIAAARREIAALDRDKQQLSDEGRLFARLADMARTAFSGNEPAGAMVNAGVSRALLLVDQLDQDFATAPGSDDRAGYFSPDRDVFERAKPEAPRPSLTTAEAKPVIEATEVERGARLVIRKAADGETPVAAVTPPAAHEATAPEPSHAHASVTNPAAPADAAAAEVTQLVPPQAKQSRVVIIRRKPEELLDVPLVDDDSSVTAA